MATEKQPKPAEVFLVSIRITGNSAADCRRFAKQIADAAEELFEDPMGPAAYVSAFGQLHYDLNLSRWEPIS
jgi:hypothetical protein